MTKTKITAAALSLMLSNIAIAQAALPPTGGELIEEQRNDYVENYEPTRKDEKITPERQETISQNETKINVKGFKISGQNVFSEEELLSILEKRKGDSVSFSDLEIGASDLSRYFQEHGYIATKVYLPEQKVKDGIVEYKVIIGTLDKVIINNNTKIHDSVLQREAQSLKPGSYLKNEDLQRAVWLLSDLSGADVKASIIQGSKPGTVSVSIDVNKRNKKQGLLVVDNYGNQFTNKKEISINYDFLNLSKNGDQLSIGGTTSGRNLSSYGFAYSIPVCTDGLKFSIGYNQLHYHLGKEYDVLDGRGIARIASAGFDYAIQRSQKHNLYVGLKYEFSKLKDEYRELGLTYGDKHSNALVLSFYGDETDRRGYTYWRIDNKFGNISFDNDTTRELSSFLNTEGSFYKVSGAIIRRQDLNYRTYLLLSARGQYSNRNLDNSEHMSLGGFNGVRAYPQGEASGDCGYLTRAELRWLIPLKNSDQQLQLATYFDHGGILFNKEGGPNNYRHLEGAGIGVIWSRYDDWFVRADYAWKIGPERHVNDSNGQFLIRAGVYF